MRRAKRGAGQGNDQRGADQEGHGIAGNLARAKDSKEKERRGQPQ